MDGSTALAIFGAIGGTSLILGAIVAVANRGISKDRIEHLVGVVENQQTLVENLQTGLNIEREARARERREMADRMAHLQGQLDGVIGDVGKRLGSEFGAAAMTLIEQHLSRLTG